MDNGLKLAISQLILLSILYITGIAAKGINMTIDNGLIIIDLILCIIAAYTIITSKIGSQ